jgi:hypothetical protein
MLLVTLYINPEGFSVESPGLTLIFIRTPYHPFAVMDSNALYKDREEKSDHSNANDTYSISYAFVSLKII